MVVFHSCTSFAFLFCNQPFNRHKFSLLDAHPVYDCTSQGFKFWAEKLAHKSLFSCSSLTIQTHLASEICATEIRLDTIYDDTLEMDTRTKHSLHRRPKRRIAIEVVPPVRSWVFRMNEPDLNPTLNHPI